MDHKLIAQLLRQLANAIEADAPVEPPAQACQPVVVPPAAAPTPEPAPQPLKVDAPEAADLIRVLTEMSKKHGRQTIAPLLAGKKVSEMTDEERMALAAKLEAFQ